MIQGLEALKCQLDRSLADITSVDEPLVTAMRRVEVDNFKMASSSLGPSHVDRKKSDVYLRTKTSYLKNNLRKVITPLRLATVIVDLFGNRSLSASLSRTRNSSHVSHVSTELPDVVIKPARPPPQVTYNAVGISANVSEPYQCLSTLPLDLLIEIMKYLDWRTILQVRKTCRALHFATTSKAIWIGLHNRLFSISRVKSRFERPLGLLTSYDIERGVLRRVGIPLGWTRAKIRRTRQRDILDEESETFHLVGGGRWLLVATLTGSVSCHDLDDTDIKEHQLIPDQIRWHRDNVVLMDVDVDGEQEVLTFTLVMCLRARDASRDRRSSEHQAIASVWGVTLRLDEEGRGVGLVATRLAFFILEKYGRVQSISILGRLICYQVLSSTHPNLYRFAILDWSNQPSTESQSVDVLLRRVIYADSCPANMRLLPRNQLVVVMANGYVDLYKLDSLLLQDTDAIPLDTKKSATQSFWSTQIHSLIFESLSPPFLVTTTSSQSARLVVFSNRGIYGLSFPMDEEDLSTDLVKPIDFPQVFTLADYTPGPFDCNYAPGYNHAVISQFRPEIVLMHYAWPDDDVDAEDVNAIAESPLQKRIVCQRWHKLGPLIDESTGRIVVSSNAGKRLVILDTSLYDPNPTTI